MAHELKRRNGAKDSGNSVTILSKQMRAFIRNKDTSAEILQGSNDIHFNAKTTQNYQAFHLQNTLQHAGQAESLWHRNYKRPGRERSTEALHAPYSRCETLPGQSETKRYHCTNLCFEIF